MSHRFVRVAVAVLCSVALTQDLRSQITVQKADVEAIFSVGKVITLLGDTSNITNFNVGRKGGPQIFDFSALLFEAWTTDTIFSIAGHPDLVSRYPAGSFGFDIPEEVGFETPLFHWTSSALTNVGQFRQRAGDTVRYSHGTPAETFMSFPMALNDSLTYTFTHTDTTYASPSYVSPGFSTTITVTNVVDAYGTLKLPGNLEVPCLRMRTYESAPHNYKGFRYVTSSGFLMMVDTRTNQPDTGSVLLDDPVFYLRTESVTSASRQIQLPATFSLEQNYPNPFNPSTMVRYQLASHSQVRLSVFDMLGREIAVLVDGEVQAGFHQTEWNAGAPSGIYFYRLEAVGTDGTRTIETKKMVLLR